MLQQVIVAAIGVAVAIYVVYRIMEGASPPRAVAMKKAFREKIQRKKHKVLAGSEFLPIFASQKDKVPWPSG